MEKIIGERVDVYLTANPDKRDEVLLPYSHVCTQLASATVTSGPQTF